MLLSKFITNISIFRDTVVLFNIESFINDWIKYLKLMSSVQIVKLITQVNVRAEKMPIA